MKIFICIVSAYLIGALNPAALISKLKHKSLRDKGTGNLGATNTMLVFGKKYGVIVMLLDISKGFFVVKLTSLFVPEIEWLAMAAGFAVVVGHCFPLYLKFKGGKGLAAFAGLVLAYDSLLFLFLLISCVILMLIINHTYILSFYATAFFSIYTVIREDSLLIILLAVSVSIFVIAKHFSNFVKALKGQDSKIRDYIKTKMFNKNNV